MGWFKDRQYIRFAALTQIGSVNNCSILDVGCGFGDLVDFLGGRGATVDYTGYDINPRLIEVAKKRHPHMKFYVVDIEEEKREGFDWIVSSGVFNYKMPSSKAFIENMLTIMFEMSHLGVAVDFMSAYVDFRGEETHHSDPRDIFDFCKSLTKWVTLRHDYLPYEFCIYMYRHEV